MFTSDELRDLAISGIVLGFCFSARNFFEWLAGYSSAVNYALAFLVALLTVGLGFLAHELCHKFTAQSFGFWARYRMWGIGLMLAVALAFATRGRFIFAAPGAVLIAAPAYWFGMLPTKRQNGLIALAGPLANIALALAFSTLAMGWPRASLLGMVGRIGFFVNIWLAAFNLIPIPPMDGHKVLSWSVAVWALATLLAWGLLILQQMGAIIPL